MEIEEMKYIDSIVAYIDILGFKELVYESISEPSKLSILHDILMFLKTKERPNEWSLEFVEIEEDAQKKGVANFDISNEVSCSCFSDTIVVSIKNKPELTNEAFTTLVVNLSYIGVELIKKGIIFRGAITIGSLIHNKNMLIGPALIEAYHLENNSAIYPRVIISKKLLDKLNYPLLTKRERYPYHQYLKRFADGCVGFQQIIYLQVIEPWEDINKRELIQEVNKVRQTIIIGLNSTFESPSLHKKYVWLKDQYNTMVLSPGLLEPIKELHESIRGFNLHYT